MINLMNEEEKQLLINLPKFDLATFCSIVERYKKEVLIELNALKPADNQARAELQATYIELDKLKIYPEKLFEVLGTKYQRETDKQNEIIN